MEPWERIVILGGGYAGVEAAKLLEKRFACRGVEVLLESPIVEAAEGSLRVADGNLDLRHPGLPVRRQPGLDQGQARAPAGQ